MQVKQARYALLASLLCSVFGFSSTVSAGPIVLDFEGLGVLQTNSFGTGFIEGVGDFYNGGTGTQGSGPGTDFGISFSSNALAIIDADAVGLPFVSGNFGGEPTPDTALFFLTGTAATVTSSAGFTDGFSFFYSSIDFTGSIDVYSGPDATGSVLASLVLPPTPTNGAPDPTGEFSPFLPIGVEFSGIAQSIDFGGTINQIAFDNITFGSSTPLVLDDMSSTSVPVPPSVVLLTVALVGVFGVRLQR